MSDETIDIKMKDGVHWITLNRPESRNALDASMLFELEQAFDEAENNQAIKVIIVQGAGGKFFAAGADIKQLITRKPLESLIPGMQGIYQKIENSKKVTIAAVDGFALGGGCELALACDIRIATKKAKFGLPELNLGVIPGAGGTQRLARMVGKGRALDMILTGKMLDGEEAERIGLVSYFVPEGELEEKINAVTQDILKKGPIAIQLAKFAVHKGYDIDRDTAMWIEKLSQAVAMGTEDKNEGTKAFIEKRQAVFRGE